MKKLKILMIAFLVIMSVSIFCSEMNNLRIANFRDMEFLSMEVLEKIEPDRVGEYVKDYQPVPGAAGRDYYLMKVRMKNNTALNSYFYPDSLWVDSEDGSSFCAVGRKRNKISLSGGTAGNFCKFNRIFAG